MFSVTQTADIVTKHMGRSTFFVFWQFFFIWVTFYDENHKSIYLPNTLQLVMNFGTKLHFFSVQCEWSVCYFLYLLHTLIINSI